MEPDAVLFDFNGVLVDDEHIHYEGFNEVLAPHGVQMTPASYAERYLGFDDRGAFTAVLADHGRAAPASFIEALIARKAEVYARRAVSELRVFPGAAALVADVAARCPVAIVSGALRAEIEGALAVMAVRHSVGFIVAAEDVAACKPDPAGYLAAIARLRAQRPGLASARIVAIEDSVAGIESARAAGLAVLAVAHTYEAPALEAAGAHAVVSTIADVTPATLAAVVARAATL